MKDSPKFIVLACVVGLSALIVSYTVFVFKTGQFSLGSYFTRFSEALSSKQDPSFAGYSGKYVDGKVVRNTIEEFGGDYFFRIKTKKNALSFGVYEKPVNSLLNDGNGNYFDYTNSNSTFYVNEESLYLTTVYRNDGGTVIGAMFEENGSGSISGTIANLYHVTDLLEAKQKYLAELQETEQTFSVDALDSYINSAKSAIDTIEQTISALKLASSNNVTDDSALNERYTNATKSLKDAAEVLAQTWQSYEEAFEVIVGKESAGHYDINTNNGSGNSDDLQFWINKFEGS